jgi:hypothetical protein
LRETIFIDIALEGEVEKMGFSNKSNKTENLKSKYVNSQSAMLLGTMGTDVFFSRHI